METTIIKFEEYDKMRHGRHYWMHKKKAKCDNMEKEKEEKINRINAILKWIFYIFMMLLSSTYILSIPAFILQSNILIEIILAIYIVILIIGMSGFIYMIYNYKILREFQERNIMNEERILKEKR